MAGHFSDQEWQKILEMLDTEPERFALPEGSREKSLVFASFKIRRLGSLRSRKGELDCLAPFLRLLRARGDSGDSRQSERPQAS
jgi:hypothetical protein